MPIEIKMPALSPTMEAGTLARWLVKEGDTVKSGDILAEIETDKATMEFETIDEGTIVKLAVAEGSEGVKVGTVIALLAGEDEDASAPPPETKAEAPASDEQPEAAEAKADVAEQTAAAPPHAEGDRVKASPLARRIAAQNGVDLGAIRGSGPAGRIVKADLEDAAPAKAADPTPPAA
uniref:biotin/lipoyl-containing protein n=1 Tax=Sphingomonas bacterium TaxID=1895847 RepID=UPI001577010A